MQYSLEGFWILMKKSIIMHFCEVKFTNNSNSWNQIPLKYLTILLKARHAFHIYGAWVWVQKCVCRWFSSQRRMRYLSTSLHTWKHLNFFCSKFSNYFMLSRLSFCSIVKHKNVWIKHKFWIYFFKNSEISN